MEKNLSLNILKKYNQPGPRYTSYPTYPAWTGINKEKWFSNLHDFLINENSLSIYVHVPFCKSLCAFCGCTKEITSNYDKAKEYLNTLKKEFENYEKYIPANTMLNEIHLGGGSPSWLKPKELKELIDTFYKSKKIKINPQQIEQSIELDPRTTTIEHCRELKSMGFNRVSLGVQDTNEKVLKSIRREQSLELITLVVNNLRENGIEQINMDLIYGLPNQTIDTIEQTITDIVHLKPTRIALYSYAHVPKIKPAQKLLEKDGLPDPEEKLLIAEKARRLLIDAGYFEIGMDHFALSTDSLYKSLTSNKLHRNFMGYTVQNSKALLGLGPSSLSDAWGAFAQNEKDYKTWVNLIETEGSAITYGHLLSPEELNRRNEILNLMCNFQAKVNFNSLSHQQNKKLENLIEDNLINITDETIYVSDLGRHFIRNICMVIDDFLDESRSEKTYFSKTF